ncbi:uncharacterized protein LOC129966599 isoform X1 [Argiope bruennichi]|uniref:uncharacterized protein LOC129966599 isoform X1 n=2 Tax=Argiope bruennichi TaxID=94029 RepID=UPI002494763E|nr:uncharacterized protein LOC129966599 isoform X1 [Argiope bruennichi]
MAGKESRFDQLNCRKCKKSMVNTAGGNVEQKGRQKNENKAQKRVPKLIISLKEKIPVIINSPELSVDESFSETIADKVKLRKRGRDSSSVEVFKSISKSILPCKKRRTSCGSSSSPSSSPHNVETFKIASKANSNKGLPICDAIKSIIELPREKVKKSVLEMDNVSSELPYKRAKHCSFNNQINQLAESSSAANVINIHELEVASYEEVSSTEPFNFSLSSPLQKYDDMENIVTLAPSINRVQTVNSFKFPNKNVKDQVPAIPSVNAPQEVHYFYLPKKEEECALNKKTTSKVCCNTEKMVNVSHNDHAYPITLNESLLKDINVDLLIFADKKDELQNLNSSTVENELKNLDSSTVEEFFSHSKELSLANQRANRYIDALTDLVIQISKQHDSQISNKLNGLVNSAVQKNSAVQLSPVNHSSQARTNQNISNIKNGICVLDSTKTSVKQFSRSPSSHSPGSKSHARGYRNTHNYNDGFRQENHVAKEKEKRKAMDERCIVYVGNIPHGYSEAQLRKRFQKFGTIKDIQIKSKVRCDFNNLDGHSVGSQEMKNYGFITFSSNQEAANAIEKGNREHELKFQLSFGARRQFVGEEYKDLDGIVAKNENSIYKHNSRSSFRPKNKDDDDFDFRKLLLTEMKARGVNTELFSKA